MIVRYKHSSLFVCGISDEEEKVMASLHQTDVKILREKLRFVEQKLIKATLAKIKGKKVFV